MMRGGVDTSHDKTGHTVRVSCARQVYLMIDGKCLARVSWFEISCVLYCNLCKAQVIEECWWRLT